MEFEEVFREFESSARFYYVKKFRQVRVEFDLSDNAARAHIHLREFSLMGCSMKCYLAQYLLPPQPEKLFLISPPGSPPADWQPVKEREPMVDYDLISAVANLSPGKTHELHTASESQPGIVVHVCEDPQNFKKHPKFVPTRVARTLP